jgi:hypothetical protein
MTDQPGPPRQISWYDLLTRDHTVCRICYNAGKTDVRLITDPAVILLRAKPGNRGRTTYVAKMKAAFRVHIASEHPELIDRVLWRKGSVYR